MHAQLLAVRHRQKPTRRQASLLSPASLQGSGNLSSPPRQTRCLFLFPPLPTWFCTFSCPRQPVLCNSFLRKPHPIRSAVRKYLLLPDGAGEIREGWEGGGYLWGNKPFPTGVMGFISASTKERRLPFAMRRAVTFKNATVVLSLREVKFTIMLVFARWTAGLWGCCCTRWFMEPCRLMGETTRTSFAR